MLFVSNSKFDTTYFIKLSLIQTNGFTRTALPCGSNLHVQSTVAQVGLGETGQEADAPADGAARQVYKIVFIISQCTK